MRGAKRYVGFRTPSWVPKRNPADGPDSRTVREFAHKGHAGRVRQAIEEGERDRLDGGDAVMAEDLAWAAEVAYIGSHGGWIEASDRAKLAKLGVRLDRRCRDGVREWGYLVDRQFAGMLCDRWNTEVPE